MHFLLPTRFIMLIAAFALLILVVTATHERGWLDDYFRVHHKAHLKVDEWLDVARLTIALILAQF